MNYLDISLLTIIAFITIRGLFRGLITELMVLIAIIFGFIAATSLHPFLMQYMISFFPDLSDGVARIISFIFIFVAVNIIVRLISLTLNKIATFTFLQPVNKVAGAVFAFTKVTLMASIILIVIDYIPGSDLLMNKIGRTESLSYQPVKKFAPFLWDIFADSDNSFRDIIPIDKINSESTNTLLKNLK